MRVDIGSITVTGTAQHAAWAQRILPPVEQVRPGLWSVPTPFPDSPLRYVLAYLVETRGGVALIDTGWPSDAAWEGLVAGVRATGHELSDIAAVLVTHGHADHFGLARRVREASGARVALHRLDAEMARNWSSLQAFAAADTEWLRQRGVAPAEITGLVPPADDDEYRFTGLPVRIRQLQEHHDQRLAEILTAVGGGDGPTTLEVAEALTWSRPWEQSHGIVRRSAIGETYAHLVHLARRGLVTERGADRDAWYLTAPGG